MISDNHINFVYENIILKNYHFTIFRIPFKSERIENKTKSSVLLNYTYNKNANPRPSFNIFFSTGANVRE